MYRRILIALFILIVGAACYKAGGSGPRKCPNGQTVYQCDVTGICGCTKKPLRQRFLLCSDSKVHADRVAFMHLTGAMDIYNEISADCEDTGGTTLPESVDPAVELRPEAWGDSTCSACVAQSCHDLAFQCAQEVGGCHCLEQCQVGSTEDNFVADLSTCGCPVSDSPIYEAFRQCAVDHCMDACFPATCECK